jgi:hypothetical protein
MLARKVTKESTQEIVKGKTKWEHISNYFLTILREIYKKKNNMEWVEIKIIKLLIYETFCKMENIMDKIIFKNQM